MVHLVVQPSIVEKASRFDPPMETARTPVCGSTGLLQALVRWRGVGVAAGRSVGRRANEAARAEVAQWVKEAAAVNARAIVTATSYLSPLTSTSERHQYCVEHLNRATDVSPATRVGGHCRPLGPR
jgi:hypothetical protein